VIGRALGLLSGLLVAIVLLTLAVANRHAVQLNLDPFNQDNPVISVQLPFYVYLLGTLISGVIFGGVATWLTQSKWRRTARHRTQESIRWKAEADRLVREREAAAAATASTSRQLAVSNR
jgi:uncharacterized integral membrane protein